MGRPDAAILAGNIDDPGAQVVTWADRPFPTIPALHVHGNHEGHFGNLDEVHKDTAMPAPPSITCHSCITNNAL